VIRERLGNRVGREEMLARQHLVQHDAERPDVCAAIDGFAFGLVKRRPEITMEMVDKFLTRMYTKKT
jgi:hypothetical protein